MQLPSHPTAGGWRESEEGGHQVQLPPFAWKMKLAVEASQAQNCNCYCVLTCATCSVLPWQLWGSTSHRG